MGSDGNMRETWWLPSPGQLLAKKTETFALFQDNTTAFLVSSFVDEYRGEL